MYRLSGPTVKEICDKTLRILTEYDQSVTPYNKVNQTVNRTYSDETLAFDT